MLQGSQPFEARSSWRLSPVLADYLSQRFSHFVDQWALLLKNTHFSSYSLRPLDELRLIAQQILAAIIHAVDTGDLVRLRECLQETTYSFVTESLSLVELVRAFLYGKAVIIPALNRDLADKEDNLLQMVQTVNDILDIAVYDLAEAYQQSVTIRIKNSQMEVERLKQRLQEVTDTDPLTHAYNQRYFQRRLIEEISRARRYRHPLSIAMLDIQGLEGIRDILGQAAGDQLLVTLSDIIRDNTRDNDILARYDDNKFILLLPETNYAGASAMVARLHAVALSSLTHGTGFAPIVSIGLSTGIASMPGDTDESERNTRVADTLILTARKRLREGMADRQDTSASA